MAERTDLKLGLRTGRVGVEWPTNGWVSWRSGSRRRSLCISLAPSVGVVVVFPLYRYIGLLSWLKMKEVVLCLMGSQTGKK